MGLFGGFKAKFTKDSKTKDKSQNNVVILKYHSFSEFDTPYKPGPPTNNIKDNGVIHNNPKQKQRPIVNSAIFEDSINDTANNIQKSFSLGNIVTESISAPSVSTSRKEHKFKSSTEPHKYTEPPKNSKSPKNTESSKNTEPLKNPKLPKNTETSSSSFQVVLPNTPSSQKIEEHKNVEDKKIKKSRKKAPKAPIITEDSRTTSEPNLQQNAIISMSSLPNDSQYYKDESEQSTLIFMTQQKSVTESDVANSGTHDYFAYGHDNNDHDFKVNVVHHDKNRTRSFSEDEISDEEEVQAISLGAMGYSSQAASIFFGDDMVQPVITRPRRFIMMDDNEHEDDKKDDHHESDNEADC